MQSFDHSLNTLSVVMPAFNEEVSIRDVVLAHANSVREMGFDAWEIVCVDDASTDRTGSILNELRQLVPELAIVRNERNRGIYGAFREGFLRSRGAWIYETGSDGQWPIANLLTMVERMRAGADLVVGVRTNRHSTYSLTRRFISFAYNALSRLVFGYPVHDAGAVKLGRRETFCANVISRNVVSAAERIVQAQRNGYHVVFVPIEFEPRKAGKATGATLANVLRSLVDLASCLFYYRIPLRARGIHPPVASRSQVSTSPRN